MVSARDWRNTIFSEGAYVSEEYGNSLGWWDKGGTKYQPPTPIVEAVIDIESNGDPNVATSPDNAIGLMQIVPTGQEASWWGEYTGEPVTGDDLTHPDSLDDPRHDNIRVGILGLGERMQQVCAVGPKVCNWYYAAAAYFGRIPDAEGNFKPGTDAFGTTGQEYYNHVANYVSTVWDFGTDKAVDAALRSGQWQEVGKQEGIFTLPDFVENTIDYAKGAYESIKDLPGQIIGVIISWFESNKERIALIAGGLAILLSAGFLVYKNATPAGMAVKAAMK